MKQLRIADILLLHLIVLTALIIIINQIGLSVWLSILMSFILTGIDAMLLGKRLTKPNLLLTKKIDDVTSGDSILKLDTKTEKEYQAMTDSLNRLMERWQDSLVHLSSHREELRLIANSIEEVLWTQRLDGKIEWMNPLFHIVFGTKEEDKGKSYWELIREPNVLSFIRDFMQNDNPRMLEINVDEQHYLITGTTNKEADRVVFIMQNIDLIRQTEKMKKDFMVNVAHELRTPLTAIKGFSAALEEDATETSLHYIKIIQRHTDRMINMISDFQTLAKLERMPELDLQEINLETFFNNIIAMYQPIMQDNNLTISTVIGKNANRITVDPFKFEQVFINLIDNAIQYTTEGGININTHVSKNDLVISVTDTGIGMEKSHLPRVFERFYVADSSRNKAVSGTGLGLAIVKHTVLLHRGTISVESNPGEGTTFTITIPTNLDKIMINQGTDDKL